MIAKCNEFGVLGGCVEPVVGGDPQTSPKKEKAVEGIVRAVAAHNREDHGGDLLSLQLYSLSQSGGGMVERGARVEHAVSLRAPG